MRTPRRSYPKRYSKPDTFGKQFTKGLGLPGLYRSRFEARAKCSQCAKTDWGPAAAQRRARMGGIRDAEVCMRHRKVAKVQNELGVQPRRVAWPTKPHGMTSWEKIRKMDRLPV